MKERILEELRRLGREEEENLLQYCVCLPLRRKEVFP